MNFNKAAAAPDELRRDFYSASNVITITATGAFPGRAAEISAENSLKPSPVAGLNL